MRVIIWLLLGLIAFVGCSKSDAPTPTARPYTEEEKAYIAGAQVLDQQHAALDAARHDAACTRTVNVNGLVDLGMHSLAYLHEGSNGEHYGIEYEVHACSDREALAAGAEIARKWAAEQGGKLIQPEVRVVSAESKKFMQTSTATTSALWSAYMMRTVLTPSRPVADELKGLIRRTDGPRSYQPGRPFWACYRSAMRFLGACTVVDALAAWGSHNAAWRLGREVTGPLDAVEFVLTYYASLTGTILSAIPIGCVRVELSAEDLPNLFIFDGRPFDVWTTAVEQDTTRSGEDVRRMAAAPDAIVGPLICTCVGEGVTDGTRVRSPFVVFDGWHRGAAWVLQGRAGRTYPIAASIIVTQRPLQGQARPAEITE